LTAGDGYIDAAVTKAISIRLQDAHFATAWAGAKLISNLVPVAFANRARERMYGQ
jgi:hypothetical protein